MTTASMSPPTRPCWRTSGPRSFFEGGRKLRRQIVTPEGVPVPIEIANYGERLTAFVIDLTIWMLLTARDLYPHSHADRADRRQPDRDLDRAVHRLPHPQSVLHLFRAGVARRDARQAHRRPARDRPQRRAAGRFGGDRAQSDARGRDVHSARRLAGRPIRQPVSTGKSLSSSPGSCSVWRYPPSIATGCAAAT